MATAAKVSTDDDLLHDARQLEENCLEGAFICCNSRCASNLEKYIYTTVATYDP